MAFSQRTSKPRASTVGASLDMIEQAVHDKLLDGKAAQVQRAALGDFGGEPMPGELSIRDLAELTKILSAAVLTRGRHEKQQQETRDRIKGEEDPRVRGARLVRKVRQVLGLPVNDTDEPEVEYEDPFADVMREEGLLPPKEEDDSETGADGAAEQEYEADAAVDNESGVDTEAGIGEPAKARNFRMRLVDAGEPASRHETDADAAGIASDEPETQNVAAVDPSKTRAGLTPAERVALRAAARAQGLAKCQPRLHAPS